MSLKQTYICLTHLVYTSVKIVVYLRKPSNSWVLPRLGTKVENIFLRSLIQPLVSLFSLVVPKYESKPKQWW